MTLDEIKQTPLFKANAPLVAKAFGEQYVEEFARELLKADPISNNIFDGLQGVDIRYAFKWADSPQGGRAWGPAHTYSKRFTALDKCRSCGLKRPAEETVAPLPVEPFHPTQRQYYAAKAMQSLLLDPASDSRNRAETVKEAFFIADAMIAAEHKELKL